MFCLECGVGISDDVSFCPQRGKNLAAAKTVTAAKTVAAAKTVTVAKIVAAAVNGKPDQIGCNFPSQAGSFSGSSFIEALSYESGVFGKVLVGAQLVLCLLSLLPYFPLDLILYSSECSIFMLLPTLSDFSGYIGSGSTGAALYIWAFVVTALWLGAIVMTALDARALVTGCTCRGLGAPLYLIHGLLALVSMFGINAYVSGTISYTFFSATVWVWLLVVISAVAVALHVYRVGPANYKDSLFR